MISRHIIGIGAIAISVVTACSFTTSSEAPPTVDAPIDGVAVSDGGACVAASSSCANATTLRTCTAPGSIFVDSSCDWGCVSGASAHCGVLQPAGGAVGSGDLSGSGLQATTLTALLIVNSDTGAIGASGNLGSFRGSGAGIKSGIEFEQTGPTNVGEFRFNGLTITGVVSITGTHAVAFVSAADVHINGVIDARGFCAATTQGPGGSSGGTKGDDGNPNLSGGQGGGGNNHGGGGGGYGGTGGSGGTGNAAGNLGGDPFGDALITVLEGGAGGGGGDGGGQAGTGGGGGGAIQVVSATQITIAATGGINAGGCGGTNGMGGMDGGGGGGAGGTVLLEAPVVNVNGRLAVNGGAGGAGNAGNMTASSAGTLDRIQAAPNTTVASGGGGGAGANTNGAPGANTSSNGGGGGGGVGRIRINTRAGSASVDPAAVMSPAFGDASTCTQGVANVQ